MLFVFGYRANKIRCKKLSVLIHNSRKFSNSDSCRVAVHFALIEDKDDGSYELVPNSEFVIAREAFKNNSSFYTINDRRVHFKEVSILLKKHNVDLDHNRFLILQVSSPFFYFLLTQVQSIVMIICNLLQFKAYLSFHDAFSIVEFTG